MKAATKMVPVSGEGAAPEAPDKQLMQAAKGKLELASVAKIEGGWVAYAFDVRSRELRVLTPLHGGKLRGEARDLALSRMQREQSRLLR